MYDLNDLFDKRSVVAARLEKAIAEQGYTKSRFCKASGISRPTLDKILSISLNSKANFDKHMEKILACLSMTPDMLLGSARQVYSRAREIRSILHIQEEELAEAVSISVDRLKEIEEGNAATCAELRDIAAYFGVSTSCIDNTYFFHPQASHNGMLLEMDYHDDDRVISGFWGHIGLLPVNDDEYYWYPITTTTYQQVREQMGNERIVIPCMNNMLLYVNPSNIKSIVLLDDNCDAPGFANWDPAVSEGEIPLVVYEALDDYMYYIDLHKAPPAEEMSPKFVQLIKRCMEDKKWGPDEIDALTSQITVHYADGNTLVNGMDFHLDNNLIDEIKWVYEIEEPLPEHKFVFFFDHDEAMTYINTDQIAFVELPLVQSEQAIHEMIEEMLAEAEE